MTTTRLAIAALLAAAALTACPPEAPLPDDTALLIINNVKPSGECYELSDWAGWMGYQTLCQNEIISVTMRGPHDFGYGPERLGGGEIIKPGQSRTFVLDLSGNAHGEWEIEIRHFFRDNYGLTRGIANLTLEDVQPGDVYNWNWGAPQ